MQRIASVTRTSTAIAGICCLLIACGSDDATSPRGQEQVGGQIESHEASAPASTGSSGEAGSTPENEGSDVDIDVDAPSKFPSPETDPGTVAPEREFTVVEDDMGIVTVQVPADWADDFDGTVTKDSKGNTVYGVWASEDLQAANDQWDVPTVQVSASTEAVGDWTPEAILDSLDAQGPNEACTQPSGREPYDDGEYQGLIEVWTNCDGSEYGLVQLAATATDNSHLVWVLMQMSERELDVAKVALASFRATF
jgi:hypothetical protein